MDVSRRNMKLSTSIIDDVLKIEIGVDTLAFVVMHSPNQLLSPFDETTGGFGHTHVINPDLFAKDVLSELEDEQEDGTTIVHLMIDDAIFRAIENGSLAISDEWPCFCDEVNQRIG